MVSRKNEAMDLTRLEVGGLYSKKEIAELGSLTPPGSPYDFGGFTVTKNTVLIFINLDRKDPLPHQSRIFMNQIDGDMAYTDSQPRQSQASPTIRRVTDPDEDVRLFARLAPKIGNIVQPFCYCGRVQCIEAYGQEPVRLHWKMLDYGSLSLTEGFQALIQGRAIKKMGAPQGSGWPSHQGGVHHEGARKWVLGNRYERDAVARQLCIQEHGCFCYICGFDFALEYGALGEGFIEVHHKAPIAERAKAGRYQLDPHKDLVPLCPNCHRMVHRRAEEGAPYSGRLGAEAIEKLLKLRADAAHDEWESI